MRLKHFIDLVQHFGDAQIGGFGYGGAELGPKPPKHILIVARPGRDIVQLLFKAGGKVIADIAPKIIF